VTCTLWFIGVSTRQSLVNKAFPIWMDDLGFDVRLVGRDLPLDAAAETYRKLVIGLSTSDDAVGAVITSHKVGLLRDAGDLIDQLDPLAAECGEVNSLRRGDGSLAGFARDPVSVGRIVDEIWPDGDHVVCLGAGGTAIALGRHLLARPAAPVQLTFTDRTEAAGAHLRGVLGPWVSARGARLDVHIGEGPWDRLVQPSPLRTLVVNATGMGKDRPGNPVSTDVHFPEGAVVWELNYRGELTMLGQARRCGAQAYDGWQLFCHGWAAALGPIFDLTDEPGTARRFTELADPLRDGRGG
jgi:shikimate dehydrogenase